MDGLEKLEIWDEHKPEYCPSCGAPVTYKGLGEYACDVCHYICYDDYGKVRVYLEKHPGANIVQISTQTGVSKQLIKKMVKENRFAFADDKPHLFE